MQCAAKVHSEKPAKPPCTRDFNPSSTAAAEVIIVYEPEPIEQWRERQKQIHPPIKMPWFHIVDDLGPADVFNPPIGEIMRAVCQHYGVTHEELLSHLRPDRLILPRWVAIYFVKILTRRSAKEIGRRFGGRDHATILYVVRKMGRLLEQDEKLAADVAAIRAAIIGAAA